MNPQHGGMAVIDQFWLRVKIAVWTEISCSLGCSSTLFSTAHSSPGSVLRSPDQLNEVVSLAHVLLPPLADSSTLVLEDQPTVADVSGGKAILLASCAYQGRSTHPGKSPKA